MRISNTRAPIMLPDGMPSMARPRTRPIGKPAIPVNRKLRDMSKAQIAGQSELSPKGNEGLPFSVEPRNRELNASGSRKKSLPNVETGPSPNV